MAVKRHVVKHHADEVTIKLAARKSRALLPEQKLANKAIRKPRKSKYFSFETYTPADLQNYMAAVDKKQAPIIEIS